MSETYSESQSILVPHNNEVQVWELTDRKDEDGNPIVQSQIEDEIDGVFGRTEKSARPGALSEEVQAGLAQILAMDRNPTTEQLERGIAPSATVEELGGQALALAGVEAPSEDEANQPNQEANVGKFSEMIGQIEADVHNRVQLYRKRAGEEIDGLINRNQQNANELQSLESDLMRMAYGSVEISATMNIAATLDHVQRMLRHDLTGLEGIANNTISSAQNMTDLVEGELPAQKKKLVGAGETDDGLVPALERTDELEAYLRQTVGVFGAIKSTIAEAEFVVSEQVTDVRRLLKMTEEMEEDIRLRRADQDSVGRFGRIVTQFIEGFNQMNVSHLATIKRSAGDLQF